MWKRKTASLRIENYFIIICDIFLKYDLININNYNSCIVIDNNVTHKWTVIKKTFLEDL